MINSSFIQESLTRLAYTGAPILAPAKQDVTVATPLLQRADKVINFKSKVALCATLLDDADANHVKNRIQVAESLVQEVSHTDQQEIRMRFTTTLNDPAEVIEKLKCYHRISLEE